MRRDREEETFIAVIFVIDVLIAFALTAFIGWLVIGVVEFIGG
jgi:hypothetical protein